MGEFDGDNLPGFRGGIGFFGVAIEVDVGDSGIVWLDVGKFPVVEIGANDAGHTTFKDFGHVPRCFVGWFRGFGTTRLPMFSVFRPFWGAYAVDAHGDVVAIHGGGRFNRGDKDAGELLQIHSGGFIGGIVGVWVKPGVAGVLESEHTDE